MTTADSPGLADFLEELPIAAFIARDGALVIGNRHAAEFAAGLLDPGARWWGLDDALPARYPWLDDAGWTGPVEGRVGATTWHLHVTTAPRPDGTSLTLCHRRSEADVRRELVMRATDVMRDMFTITTADLDAPGPAYVVVNQTFERLSGYDRGEALGQTPRILQGPRTDRAEVARLRRCLETDEPFRGGTINYRKNGDPFFNEWSIAAVTSASGAGHYVSVMRDATDERLRADQIEVAATEWARVVDVLDELVVFVDVERRILRCNEGFRRLTGATFVALIGRELGDLLFADTPPAVVERILGGDRTPTRLPGHAGWFRITNHVVHDGPVLAGCVYVLDDITAREQAADEVRRLVAAIEQAQDGLALLADDGRIEYLNEAYGRLLGVDRHAAIGVDGHRLLAAADGRATFEAGLSRARSEGVAITVRATPGSDVASHRHELSIGPLSAPDGSFTGYAVSARDVSEHERLARLSEATSAMDNMGHWLSGLRHELGNPVNSVKMALTVLASNLASMPSDEILRYVERALSELGRVEYLLRTLRTVSAVEHLDFERVEIAGFLAQLTAFVESDLRRRGLGFAIDCGPEVAAHADPHALMQVLVNLMANAADALATRGGGMVEVTAWRHAHEVHLTVRDNGAGMPAARLARLYTPFETTKATGTGLGLVIVRKLMLAMNGRIEIDSTEGVGTVVTLTLAAR